MKKTRKKKVVLTRWQEFKLWVMWKLDWVDEVIFRHRFYWICKLIGNCSWWQ